MLPQTLLRALFQASKVADNAAASSHDLPTVRIALLYTGSIVGRKRHAVFVAGALYQAHAAGVKRGVFLAALGLDDLVVEAARGILQGIFLLVNVHFAEPLDWAAHRDLCYVKVKAFAMKMIDVTLRK